MAAGDVYQAGPTSLATNAFLNAQPGGGVEVTVHNIYCGAAAELYYYDGANSILIDQIETGGGWLNQAFHCTNSKYIRVKNTGASAYFAVDGMVTK
jgi:hypothetical protein